MRFLLLTYVLCLMLLTSIQADTTDISTEFVVQIATYKRIKDAENTVAEYKAKGYDAYIVEVENPTPKLKGMYYRVRVKGFANDSEAVEFNNLIGGENAAPLWVDTKANDSKGIDEREPIKPADAVVQEEAKKEMEERIAEEKRIADSIEAYNIAEAKRIADSIAMAPILEAQRIADSIAAAEAQRIADSLAEIERLKQEELERQRKLAERKAKKKKRIVRLSIGTVSATLFGIGYYHNARSDELYNAYMDAIATEELFEQAWQEVKKAERKRNVSYILSGATASLIVVTFRF